MRLEPTSRGDHRGHRESLVPDEPMMAERKQLEFFLLRYVPDAVKDEFVNIGVVMVEPGANGGGFADVRFTRDWRRVRCFDPAGGCGDARGAGAGIRGQLARRGIERSCCGGWRTRFPMRSSFRRRRLAWRKNRCKRSRRWPVVFGGGKVAGKREPKGRQRILERMREAFEQAGVLGLLSDGDPARHTRKQAIRSSLILDTV